MTNQYTTARTIDTTPDANAAIKLHPYSKFVDFKSTIPALQKINIKKIQRNFRTKILTIHQQQSTKMHLRYYKIFWINYKSYPCNIINTADNFFLITAFEIINRRAMISFNLANRIILRNSIRMLRRPINNPEIYYFRGSSKALPRANITTAAIPDDIQLPSFLFVFDKVSYLI